MTELTPEEYDDYMRELARKRQDCLEGRSGHSEKLERYRLKMDRRPPLASPRPWQPQQPTSRGTGWADFTPISSPPGVALCDRMLDAQDARDRAELVATAVDRARRIGAISTPAQPTEAATQPTKTDKA
jgi:hypothetical protein